MQRDSKHINLSKVAPSAGGEDKGTEGKKTNGKSIANGKPPPPVPGKPPPPPPPPVTKPPGVDDTLLAALKALEANPGKGKPPGKPNKKKEDPAEPAETEHDNVSENPNSNSDVNC
eukprot:NODE_734_length_1389_cov_3.398051.p4 GENE.NODE_734_length_1389_cov_3.398051~~NODE_734_length_1389_cov_3.398051.p4  ORF type:complete len:116 (+),score=39.05 NODE_734_length_1389_cov_3.398051:1030-1377(+)